LAEKTAAQKAAEKKEKVEKTVNRCLVALHRVGNIKELAADSITKIENALTKQLNASITKMKNPSTKGEGFKL